MTNSMEKYSLFIKLEYGLTMLLLAAIVLLVFFAAVMRSFGWPIIWSVDLAQLFFAWLSMLAANQALRKSEHVGVDLLVRNLSWQLRLKLDLLLYSLMIIGLLALLVFGVQLTLLNPQRLLGSTSLSYSLVTLAVPVGALLMLTTISQQWLVLARLIGKPLPNIDCAAPFVPSYIRDIRDIKGSKEIVSESEEAK